MKRPAKAQEYYYDIEAIEQQFCDKENCQCCEGTDCDGEPNGYGCDVREDYVSKKIVDMKEISDIGFHSLFVTSEDYSDLNQYCDNLENALKMVSQNHKLLDQVCDMAGVHRFTDMINAVEEALKEE